MAATPAPRWRWFERWMAWAGWLGLVIEGVLWFTVWDLDVKSLPVLLPAAAVLILGTAFFTVILTVCYRRFWGTWYGLAALVAALVAVSWGRSLAPMGSAAGFLLMLMVGLIPAVAASVILLLLRRDVSAELVGLVLLAFVWGSLLASVPHGGPVRAWLRYLTASETGQFWWFESLTCLLMLILPIGSVAFVLHLVRLGLKEVQGAQDP